MKNKLQNAIYHLPIYILFVYIFLNIISFWSAEKRELLNNFEDDAYYYFKIAKNVVEHNSFTFDGRTLANGFHPLWMSVVLPLSYAIRDPFIFLRVLGILSSLAIGAITYIGFKHIQNRFSLTSYAIAAIMLLACIIVFGTTGMETTILIPLVITSLLLLIRISPWKTFPADHNSNKDWFVLGAVLSFVQLARLDAILFNITVLAFITLLDRSSRKWKHLVIVSVPIFVSGATYLIVNYFAFQHFMPTSGLAKSMKVGLINDLFIRQMLDLTNPGTLWNIYLSMVFVAFWYMAHFIITQQYKRRNSALYDDHHYIALIVSAFFLLYTGYQLFGTSWVLWRWYGYPIYLMSIFVVPLVVEKMLIRLGVRPNLKIPVYVINNIIRTLILTLMAILGIRYGYWREHVNILFAYQNYLIANELNQRFPEPVIFAMGDRAGSFAYFFNGEVVQLEGLVGDYSIIQAIKNNTLMNYMTKSGVQYIMSQVAPPANYIQWTLLTPLPQHTSGPNAEIRLCKKSEVLHRVTEFDPIYIWKWPSCDQ
jgi:hypothetical protein